MYFYNRYTEAEVPKHLCFGSLWAQTSAFLLRLLLPVANLPHGFSSYCAENKFTTGQKQARLAGFFRNLILQNHKKTESFFWAEFTTNSFLIYFFLLKASV